MIRRAIHSPNPDPPVTGSCCKKLLAILMEVDGGLTSSLEFTPVELGELPEHSFLLLCGDTHTRIRHCESKPPDSLPAL